MRRFAYEFILQKRGFTPFGNIRYPFPAAIFWHPALFMHIVVINLGEVLLVKGIKPYYLRGVCEQGEIYERDIPALHRTLQSLFDGLHMSMLYQRDITESMALRRIAEKGFRGTGDQSLPLDEKEKRLEKLKEQFEKAKQNVEEQKSFTSIIQMEGGNDPMLSQCLRQSSVESKQKLDAIANEGRRLKNEVGTTRALLGQYLRRASGTAFFFSCHSNLQAASCEKEFRDAVDHIVMEIRSAHVRQIQQKMNFSRLNLPVAEVTEPGTAWLMEYCGGLNPRELLKFGARCDKIRSAIEQYFMVFPTSNIILGGAVKDEQKLIHAKIVETFLRQLDRLPKRAAAPEKLPKKGKLAWIGAVMAGNKITNTPFMLPIGNMLSGYVSGFSGSGKSFFGRLVVEGGKINGIRIIILDPRNQAIGLLLPEDRPEILKQYKKFGMSKDLARGFDFRYIAPGEGINSLPENLEQLLEEDTIISFRGMNDKERCSLFAHILEAILKAYSQEESESIRVIIVIEEAHLFTAMRMVKTAKEAGKHAEIELDRMCREGRKYGIRMLLISQSSKDYTHASITIRGNTPVKCFFANAEEREMEYANGYLADGRVIARLPVGVCVVTGLECGEVKIACRPPFSKTIELSTAATRKLVSGTARPASILTTDEQRALDTIRTFHQRTRKHPNISKLGEELGIKSTGKLWALVSSLEQKGLVETKQLRAKGRPRVIIPVEKHPATRRK